MKPKVALVKDGFLPAGSENKRGRLSGEAKSRLAELASQGWQIEGYSDAPVSPAKPTASTPKREPAAESTGVVDVPEPYRDENSVEAFYMDGDRAMPVGMRHVCNTCGSSLTHCPCPTPKIWHGSNVEFLVEFKSRTKPLSKKWW